MGVHSLHFLVGVTILAKRIVFCSSLVASVLLMTISCSSVTASLCQTVTVSSTYPHQAFPNQRVEVVTTVTGSCTSDGEDYFAVRVDLVDKASKLTLATNSTMIGYNANNFSVHVDDAASTPSTNQTWPIEVNTYFIQAGGVSGKYLLNATTITVQVGAIPVPEFQIDNSLILSFVLLGITFALTRVKSPKNRRRNS
jgi:hypothetical protein